MSNTSKKRRSNDTSNQDSVTVQLKQRCIINGSNNLWVCASAMNSSHSCVFCKCTKCYLGDKNAADTKCSTRGRWHYCMKSIDDKNLTSVNTNKRKKYLAAHHSDSHLLPYSDSTYFSKLYQKQIAASNHNFIPSRCFVCSAMLVDK